MDPTGIEVVYQQPVDYHTPDYLFILGLEAVLQTRISKLEGLVSRWIL